MANTNKYLDNNGLLYLWQQIKNKLAGKVDVEAGKGLSTNDFTNAEKEKLAGIAEGATKVIVNNTLTSDSATEALAAAQGKVLAEQIAELEDSLGELGYGDMLKSVYDTDGDGVVDDAAKLGGVVAANYALKSDLHAHANKDVLDGITSAKVGNWDAAYADSHTHANKTVLDGISAEKVAAWDAAEGNAKAYADGLAGNYDASGSAAQALTDAKAYADGLAENYDAAGSAAQALTDAKAYTDEKIGDIHAHANKEVLDGISATKVAAWDAAEGNAKAYAKDYADGLNTTMNGRVEALEAIDHTHTNKEVLDGVTAEKVAAWDGAVAAVPGKADKATTLAGYGIGDAYTKTEVDSAVATAKTEAIEAVLDGVAEDYDTLKEVAAWIEADTTNSAELIARVSAIEADYYNSKNLIAITNAEIDAIMAQ